MTENSDSNPAWAGPAATALVALVACAHAWFAYKGFAMDEAFVGFRVAERLSDGLGLTWTDGELLERHREPLFIAVLSIAEGIDLEAIRAARWGGYLGLLLAVISVSLDPDTWRPSLDRALTGGVLLALTGGLAAAAMSGTAGALLAGLVAAGAVGCLRVARPGDSIAEQAALALVLAAVTGLHADGWLLSGGLLTGGLLATRSARPWVAPALGPLFVLGVLTAWRATTLGSPLPPTVPTALDPAAVATAAWWMVGALGTHVVLSAGAAAGALQQPDRPVVPIAGVAVVLWLGGRMVLEPAGSFWIGLVPVLPLLALLATIALGPLLRSAGGMGLLVGLAFGHGAVSSATGDLDEARRQHSEWYAPPMAHILRTAFGDREPTLAVEQPGVLPYWTGFPTTVLSETDDLWANKPDIVVFGGDLGALKPTTPAGRKLLQRPDFLEYYQPVGFTARSVLVGRIKATVYLLREGGKMGISRSRDAIEIPGWFAASPGSWATRWNGSILAAPLTEARTSAVPRLLLRAGRWEVVSDDGPIGVDFRCGPLSATRTRADPSPVLVLEEPGHVDVVLWAASEQGVPLESLTVRATDREPTHHCDPIPTAPWSLLRREVPPGSPWDAPGAMLFGEDGVRVLLDGPITAEELVLSLDGNDPYALRWLSGTTPAGRTPVYPAQAGGLQPRRVAVPPRARERGADRLLIVPAGGDDSWSLGAIRTE